MTFFPRVWLHGYGLDAVIFTSPDKTYMSLRQRLYRMSVCFFCVGFLKWSNCGRQLSCFSPVQTGTKAKVPSSQKAGGVTRNISGWLWQWHVSRHTNKWHPLLHWSNNAGIVLHLGAWLLHCTSNFPLHLSCVGPGKMGTHAHCLDYLNAHKGLCLL